MVKRLGSILLLAAAIAMVPQAARAQFAERSGKQVVDAQCSKCHAKGVKGAPKIGDKADLTDSEVKSAIMYMFNPAASTAKPKAKAEPAAAPDPSHKSIGGMEIYLGVLPADQLRSRHGADAEKKMYGGIPSGKGYFLVNVTLRDSGTKGEIRDAQVEARVANLMTGETKKLEAATINNGVSYGNYFQMPGKDPYTVTLQIRKPGAAAVEAKFDFRQ